MKETYLYKKLDKSRVRCNLCPNRCAIEDGEKGRCRVRKNNVIASEIRLIHFGE